MTKPREKALFILKHRSLGPSAIIAAGAKQGVRLSMSYVHKILSEQPDATPTHLSKPPPHDDEVRRADFQALVMRVGTDRAQEWLTQIAGSVLLP